MSGWTVGALVFYEGGEYGHVAICAEDSGVIFSTDLPNKGKVQPLPSRLPPICTDHQVGRVAADAPVKDWGMKLLGYTVACVHPRTRPPLFLCSRYVCLQIFPKRLSHQASIR